MSTDFIKNIEQDLKNQKIYARVLLDSLVMLNEQSRSCSFYQDPTYAPFYYYLGKYITPKTFLEIDTGIAVNSSCFFKSCKTVDEFFCIQEKTKDNYTPRFALKNIKMNYKKSFNFHYGSYKDEVFESILDKKDWDLAFINKDVNLYDELLGLITKIWLKLSINGILVLDFVKTNKNVNKCYENFCKITKNLETNLFNTRYGTAVLIKK